MYYHPNPHDSSHHGPAGVLDAEGIARMGSPSAAHTALSSPTRNWLDTLRRPGMWCEPAHQHRLMCALGAALLRTPGFPDDHGLLIGDVRSDEPLLHERHHAPRFAVLAGHDGTRPRPRHGEALCCFLMRRSGVTTQLVRDCGTAGDSFFTGLVTLLDASGHLHGLLSQHRLKAGRSKDMLRELLVSQLAAESPALCESLSTLGLWRTDDRAMTASPERSPSLSPPLLPLAPLYAAESSASCSPPFGPPWLAPQGLAQPAWRWSSPALPFTPPTESESPADVAAPVREQPQPRASVMVTPPPRRQGHDGLGEPPGFITMAQYMSGLIDAIFEEGDPATASTPR